MGKVKMRYRKIVEDQVGKSIKGSFVVLLVLFVIAIFFIFPYELKLQPDAYSLTDTELLNVEFPKGCYEKIMKDSNFINGGEVYRINKKTYYAPINEARELYVYNYGNTERLYSKIPSGPVYCNGYWISMADDGVVVGDGTEPYTAKGVAYNWVAQAYDINNCVNYAKAMEILKKQHVGEIHLSEMVVILGLTKAGSLLNYNGEYAVFANKNVGSGVETVELIKYYNDGKEEKLGSYEYNSKIRIVAFSNFICFTTKDTFYRLNVETGELFSEYITAGAETPTILSHGYYEHAGKYYYMFETNELVGIIGAKDEAFDGEIYSVKRPKKSYEEDYNDLWYLKSTFGRISAELSFDNKNIITIKRWDKAHE